MIKKETIKTGLLEFRVRGRDVTVSGYPPLDGCEGCLRGEGMAFFMDDDCASYLVNMRTGKIRQLSAEGRLLVEDGEIDLDAVGKMCPDGFKNARSKRVAYGPINTWGDFAKGITALCWTLYPDGEYFMDEDGFGMESGSGETVYAIIDSDLNIIEPFRPMEDVHSYLRRLRRLIRI